MPLSCSVFFCILTLSLLPSSGSKFPFDALGCFGVSSIPAFFEEVSLSFIFISLCPHFSASLYHSYSSTYYDYITPVYCCYFFCFHLGFTNALSAATLYI